MKPLFAIAPFLLVLLSGCLFEESPAATLPEDDGAAAALANATTTHGPLPVLLAVDAPQPTQNETVTLTGTIDQPARLLVTSAVDGVATELARVDVAQDGAWSLAVPVAGGRTNLTVTAETGAETAQATVLAVRLLSATLEVLFTAAVPPHPDVADLVWYDPDGHASAPAYEGTTMAHPPHANVHDLMVSWSTATGKEIVYSYFDGLGFSPDEIDGVGQPLTSTAPPYWCYTVNGATADFGISLQELNAGDVVTWEYGACA